MDLICPFFDAIALGDEPAVSHLLALGTSINSCDMDGRSALHIAAGSQWSEKLVPFLIKHGAQRDARDNLGRTPLHYFALYGRSYGAACLLHQGSDPNVFDSLHQNTPLHLAVMEKHKDVIRVLLAYGARTSIANSQGVNCRDLGISEMGL